jgi:NADH-quinone oxidoreductase subunit J
MIEIAFYVLAAVALGSAVGVVLQKNPVGSLIFMVTTLSSIAWIFVLLEAHFLAAIQVIVYAGAIMVLFLFVIMLLNLGHEYHRDLKSSAWVVLGFAVCGGVAGVLARTFGGSLNETEGAAAASIDAMLVEKGAVGIIADPLFTDFVVAFELVGILLLIAIVGAIALAKRQV